VGARAISLASQVKTIGSSCNGCEKHTRLLSFLLGVEKPVLDNRPTDRNKYAGISATVFFTGVLAFCSSGYALYTVFNSAALAVGFGLLWGLMTFNLDRYIVMSMKSPGPWWREL
jgi:hypothetical protein